MSLCLVLPFWQVSKASKKQKVKSLRKHKMVKALQKHMKKLSKAKADLEEDGKDKPLEGGEGDGVETPPGAGLGEGDGVETPPGGGLGEAPATPEPLGVETLAVEAPATAEPEQWPEAGVKVAVGVEHLTQSLRLGETGVSEGTASDAPDEVVVRLDSPTILASLRIPRSLLVSVGAPMRNLRLWDKWNEVVKRDLLKQLGVGDPRAEVLPSTTALRATMWGEYVPIGLKVEEQTLYHFVQPAFVSALVAGTEVLRKVEAGESSLSFAALEEESNRQDARVRLLKDWWGQHEVLLVCLCDEASNSAALLALRKNPFSVRFYEVEGFEIQEVSTSTLVSEACAGLYK